jgi:AcrR family transcriptional regulator
MRDESPDGRGAPSTPANTQGVRVAERSADARRDDLLDAVMRTVTVRGFSDIPLSELARYLHCSTAELHTIAPSRDDLVALAVTRWGELTLGDLEDQARRGLTASERARIYFRGGARSLCGQSSKFRADLERVESTRVAWRTISDAFVDRFVELAGYAVDAGEIRQVNRRFLGEMLRKVAVLVRDGRVLGASGLTAGQAVLEIDAIIWGGIQAR